MLTPEKWTRRNALRRRKVEVFLRPEWGDRRSASLTLRLIQFFILPGRGSRYFERPKFSTEPFSGRKEHNPFADKRFRLPKIAGTEPDPSLATLPSANERQSKFMDRAVTTLLAYRLLYSDRAAVPTHPPSGLLGLLLYRQDLAATGSARHRTVWRRLCAAPSDAFVGLWRALAAPVLLGHSDGRVGIANQPRV